MPIVDATRYRFVKHRLCKKQSVSVKFHSLGGVLACPSVTESDSDVYRTILPLVQYAKEFALGEITNPLKSSDDEKRWLAILTDEGDLILW